MQDDLNYYINCFNNQEIEDEKENTEKIIMSYEIIS